MGFISEVHGLVDDLAALAAMDVPARELAGCLRLLDDDVVLDVIEATTTLINSIDRLRIVSAGIAAERSGRDRGYAGIAQTHGHRTPEALIQAITGGTRAEAAKQIRVGESMLECGMPVLEAADPGDAARPEDAIEAPVDAPWHEPLRQALLDNRITSSQHDAIHRGLGEPPIPEAGDVVEIDGILRAIHEVREVWRIAAEQLLAVASGYTAEELRREAQRTRDLVHPEGAAARSAQRHENRAFRMWRDEAGQPRAYFALDDEGEALIRAMIDAGLRPRRGGPRFVSDEERESARALIEDPRSNDQLAYDLLIATLKAGALATPEKVFGARQPGVRMIVEQGAVARRDAFGRVLGVGRLEDRGDIVAGPIIDRAICETGFRKIVVSDSGDPLYLGHEQRLFSAKQKLAMAIRDGGCLFPGCSMPASYTEAHHIDHVARDNGRTDVDRGVLLCAFHHLLMHSNGWEITRDGLGRFVLHPPPVMGEPIPLEPKTPLVYRLAS